MPAPDVDAAAGYLVKRVQQAFRRRSDAALRSAGVSISQYAVLRQLADHPEASAAELARRCFVTRQSLQDVLAGLRAAGFVETAADAAPRGRARALALTPAGRKHFAAADSAVFGIEEAMVDGLTRAERSELSRLLARCADNLETE